MIAPRMGLAGVLAAVLATAAAGLYADPITFKRDLDMEQQRVIDLGAPQNASDAATKAYVDAATNIADVGTAHELALTNNTAVYGGSNSVIIMTGAPKLTRTVWDDVRVPVTATQRGGSKDPAFNKFTDNGSASQGVFLPDFNDAQEEELYFSAQFPHTYKAGTRIYPHIHYSIKTAPGAEDPDDVVWGLEYTWASIGSTFGNTTVILCTNDVGDTAMQHMIAQLPSIDGSAKGESSMLIGRVFRDADNVTDTYGNDATMLEIDFHFEVEKLGTLEQIPSP